MNYSVRDLVYIGIFGALWGTLEMSLGSVLHALNVPFTGVIMTALGMMIILTGRSFVPRRGSLVMMGAVTMALKALSIGGIVINPMIAILAESLLAEVGVLALGDLRSGFVLGGALAVTWNLVHPFLTQGILAGAGMVTIYQHTLERGAALLGLAPSAVLWVIVGLLAVHLGTGAISGWLAWDLAAQVERRLGRTPSQG